MAGIRPVPALVLLGLLPLTAGCLFIAVPVDVHAGPGRSLIIGSADTGRYLTDATILVEHYRIEGPMHAAPVVVLTRMDVLHPGPDGAYRLRTRIRFRTQWLVWMPEIRFSPVREVVAIKVLAPGHETAWFPVDGPLEGLDLLETQRGKMLLLRLLTTPEEREAAIERIAAHGWPPGPKPAMADVVVEPAVREEVARIMVSRHEQLLTDFPDYKDAPRVRVALARWRKSLPAAGP